MSDNASQVVSTSMDDLNAFIDRDITSRMQRQSWKQMDICFKWKLIQDYMNSMETPCKAKVVADIRHMLRANELVQVEYDGTKVLKINACDI